jgi:soluble lytic murein transglycosylase
MHRLTIVVISILSLAAAREGGPDEHVWRGEFDRALTVVSGMPDAKRAAYYMMVGRVEEASSVMTADSDRFSAGIVAFKAERYEKAIRVLDTEMTNRYLEVYRRFARGSSRNNLRFYRAAAAEFDSLFALVEAHEELNDHPVIERAVNIYAGLVAHLGIEGAGSVGRIANNDRLSGGSRFLLSRMYFDAGEIEEAERWFFSGIETRYDTAAYAMFEDAACSLSHRFSRYDEERVLAIADYSLHRPRSRIAKDVATFLLERYSGGEIRLREARSQAGIGNVKHAISISRHIFESSAPVDVKKEALLLIASLEYRLKRYGSAAESYRIFGMYYPSDDRSVMALDTAARIEVARGNWRAALSIWKTLRNRGDSSRLAQSAALSEAVLRYHLGSRGEAHRILDELLPDAHHDMAAALLYWLHRTAASKEAGAGWVVRLRRDHPHSFYTAVAECGEEFPLLLSGTAARVTNRGELGAMERREREVFETIQPGLPASDPLLSHPAYQAYTYFLSHGMLEEASDCGGPLMRRFGGDWSRMISIYREARSSGMIGLALSLANSRALFAPNGGLPAALRYPVGYSGVIGENSVERGIPACLALAVIREESRFDPAATSRAGAVGLMQIMPSTGGWLATKIGIFDFSYENLFDPSFSITAGCWYLRHLLDRYDGSVVAALAAYNAGRSRIKSWARYFVPATHPMVAVELIGIRETREYVKRVLDAMAAYHSLYTIRSVDES